MTRLLFAAAALTLLAPSAFAQDQDPEPTELEMIQRNARDFHVITVMRQGTGYVYDVDGWNEESIALAHDGALVFRAPGPGLGHVLVVVEPAFPGDNGSAYNAATMTPSEPTARVTLRGTSYDAATVRRVRILVCTAPGTEGACTAWQEARPLSGGDGLFVHTLGISVPYGQVPTSDRNKARDDG